MLNVIKKNLSRDVSWAYMAQGMGFLSSIIFIPFLIRTLSNEEMGLWYLFLGVSGFATLFDFGFGPTITRNITYADSGVREIVPQGYSENAGAERNQKLLSELLSFSQNLYRFVSMLLLLILIPVGYLYFQNTQMSFNLEKVFACLVYLLAILISFWFQPFNFLVLGLKKIREYNVALLAAKMMYVSMGILVISFFPRLLTLCIIYLMSVVFERLLMGLAARDDWKPISLSWQRFQEILKLLFYNSSRHGLCAIGSFFSFRVNILIAGAVLSAGDISSFGLTNQVLGLVNVFSMALLTTKAPQMSRELCLGNTKEAMRLFSYSWVSGVVMYLLLGLLGGLLAPYFLDFIHSNVFWMSSTLYLFLLLTSFLEFNTGLFMVFMVTDNHIPYTKALIFTGGASIFFTYLFLFVFHLGLLGAVLSTFISQAIFNNWYWIYYFSKRYQISFFSLWSEGMREFKLAVKGALL